MAKRQMFYPSPLPALVAAGLVVLGAPTSSQRIAHATRIEHPPKVDGDLADPVWEQAQAFGEFHQIEPLEGAPTE
jgi:hypothetical protein